MDDVLVLEDKDICIKYIKDFKPEGFTLKLVINSQEFREYLDKGGEAKIYFLDDKVPLRPNAIIDYFFISNCSYLLEKKPDAKIFYTGNTPREKQEEFCKKHNIEIVDKFDLWKIVQRELK